MSQCYNKWWTNRSLIFDTIHFVFQSRHHFVSMLHCYTHILNNKYLINRLVWNFATSKNTYKITKSLAFVLHLFHNFFNVLATLHKLKSVCSLHILFIHDSRTFAGLNATTSHKVQRIQIHYTCIIYGASHLKFSQKREFQSESLKACANLIQFLLIFWSIFIIKMASNCLIFFTKIFQILIHFLKARKLSDRCRTNRLYNRCLCIVMKI